MLTVKDKLHRIKAYDWKKLFLELIVVFLGVTAGFLLNNWQLQRQGSSLEKKYLGGFLQDAVQNIAELRTAVKSDSIWLSATKPKLIAIQKGRITLDSADNLVKQIVKISKADIQNGTYEDIINSGNLHIISNYDLKKEIVNYHVTISGVEFIDNYFYKYFNEFVMPFVFSNYNILAGKLEDPKIIRKSQFGNIVTGYFSMIQQRKASYEGLLNKSIALKDKLKGLNITAD